MVEVLGLESVDVIYQRHFASVLGGLARGEQYLPATTFPTMGRWRPQRR